MDAVTLPLGLAIPDDPRIVVSEGIYLEELEGVRLVFLYGVLFFQYEAGDRDGEAFLVATLARDGHARVKDLAHAFGIDAKTVYRLRKRLEKDGVRGLLGNKRGPKGAWKIDRAVRQRIVSLKESGLSDRAVGRHVGLAPGSVGRVLREEGYQSPESPTLPGLEPEVLRDREKAAPLIDVAGDEEGKPHAGDPRETEEGELPDLAPRAVAEAVRPRVVERALAARGLLVEAAPVLEPGNNLRGVGLLLALPCLLELGVFEATRKVYRALKPGFYGLSSFLLTLLFMALFRIKRPEGLKGFPPEVLGRLLGLDRSPEVKTVRRKLTEIAGRGKSHEFVGELAKRIRDEHEDLLGFLYVDGHVRVYSGRRTLPKTWAPCRRLCLPATTEYWVNDAQGDPFFFVTAEGNTALSKILPGLMEEVKGVLSDRRATVIFDRGGWSQKTLPKIVQIGFDYITYRRRPYEDLDEGLFKVLDIEGRQVELAEGTAEFKMLGVVRIVAKRDPDGKQVHIVTNLKEKDLATSEVYLRMIRRWRQENFFKYMKEELALDALVSYEMVPADGDRLVPNPRWKQLDRHVREQRAKVKKLEHQLGACALVPEEDDGITPEDIEGAIQETARLVVQAEEQLARRLELRRAMPKRVPLHEAIENAPKRLEFERKTFTDALKMSAYRAESALVNAVTPGYRRARHEARKLVQEALHASGDLLIDGHGITVRLEPLSSAHRTRVLKNLCETLTGMNAVYPGTKLPLRYELRKAADRAE